MRQWTIDAFTARPLGGNPACVVEPLEAWPETGWMQAVARENNAGATAFLVRSESPRRFALRWFTAAVEVPLCGHATLAAAHALFSHMGLEAPGLAFETSSGELSVRRRADSYEMAFPAQEAEQIQTPPGLAEALGVQPVEVWKAPYLVALLDSAEAVRAVDPQLEALRAISMALGGQGNVGVAARAEAGSPYDVIDRFFAPGYGIPEDAATGSFHCILAPLYARKLETERLRFHKASPGRGADLGCRMAGARVLLSGRACTTIESVLRVRP